MVTMELRDYQIRTLDAVWAAMQTQLTALMVAPCSAGKCHGKGTEILMYDGGVKKVEDIRPGDRLMGPDSRPRTVLSVATGREMLYRVQTKYAAFRPFVCNESHVSASVCVAMLCV